MNNESETSDNNNFLPNEECPLNSERVNPRMIRKRDFFEPSHFFSLLESSSESLQNKHEKIIFCVDVCVTDYVLYRISCHLILFSDLKHRLHKKLREPIPEFAIILLESSKAKWHQDFTCGSTMLNIFRSLRTQQLEHDTFDLNSLYETICDHVELPGDTCPGYIVRPVIYYGRSDCMPQFSYSPEKPAFENFLSEFIMVDLLRIIDEHNVKGNKIHDDSFKVYGASREDPETNVEIGIIDLYIQVSPSRSNFNRCLKLIMVDPFLRPRLPGFLTLTFTIANDKPPDRQPEPEEEPKSRFKSLKKYFTCTS